ncbi:MAG: UDP-N-acetylmuramate dehydrogenase [Planctomycetota bacterium]|nr:MAG: UDP-N-acetylmuramate dehydrogenase [Planctomycetota bacterium]
MTVVEAPVQIDRGVKPPTWIGAGGVVDMLAHPASEEELLRCLVWARERGLPVRVLGEGANLLVHDAGADGVAISLRRLRRVETVCEEGEVVTLAVQAGASLQQLLIQCARQGWAGLEGLAGVPASVGGACFMNAGGAFGEFGDVVRWIETADVERCELGRLEREATPFAYRHSGLEGRVVTRVGVTLRRDEPAAVRRRLKEVMARKKAAQPLGKKSAGCAFKNPEVDGRRVSAGRLIDEAGCKGLRVGGACVSEQHANFIVTDRFATAENVLALMERVKERVLARCGVTLEREIVVWERQGVRRRASDVAVADG